MADPIIITSQPYTPPSSGGGDGDMKKSVYDTNGDGIVDNADKVRNHEPSSERWGNPNTLVLRDGSGYIQNSWFNSSRGLETSPAESYLYDIGDGFMRKKTVSDVRSELGGAGKGFDADKLDGQEGSYYLNYDNLTNKPTSLPSSGGNADTVGGYYASQLQWNQSGRDFPNGTLIQTDIWYGSSEGEPFLLEIEGNSYGFGIPIDLKLQGYIYNNTIINSGGISNGKGISGLVAFNYNNHLCFWFPSQDYWQGYNIFVTTNYAGIKKNRMTSVTNSAKPSGITKEVSFTIYQSYHTGNVSIQQTIPTSLSSGSVCYVYE